MSDLFSTIIISWYSQKKRDLPWRMESDPFKIWLSEIILQQTQVSQGLSYYLKFIDRFDDVHQLASASEEEVLKLWQGLGYYSRARNLHFTSKFISQSLGGEFPKTFEDIIKLKGVGQYTAAAIASFAFKEKVAVLDGNVFRVLSRVFGIDEAINTSQGEKVFRALAQSLLPSLDSHIYNQAIMEFGALQCVPKSPNCSECPLLHNCKAYEEGAIEMLPVKINKTKVKPLFIHFFIVKRENYIWLKKREGSGIWQNLWEFPNVSTSEQLSVEDAIERWLNDSGLSKVKILKSYVADTHLLSHKKIFSQFHLISGIGDISNELGTAVKIEDYESYPVHRLMSRFMEFNEDILRY